MAIRLPRATAAALASDPQPNFDIYEALDRLDEIAETANAQKEDKATQPSTGEDEHDNA
jgi:hypothetical protein